MENSALAQLIDQLWPGVPVIPSIGNNDISLHNAPFVPLIDFAALANAWTGVLPPSALTTFLQGGYYSMQVEENLLVIALNTIDLAWGTDCTNVGERSQVQMTWLHDVLAGAPANTSIVISGHVPPTLWHTPTCRTLYANLARAYQVSAHIYGHQHQDVLNFLDMKGNPNGNASACEEQIVAFGAPAILPATNPAIRMLHFDGEFRLADYTQYCKRVSLVSSFLPRHSVALSFR